MNHSHIPPEENVVCDSLNLALILPPRTRHWIILTMDRVIHTTGTKLILSKSKYNNLGLTLCSETCQGRHLLLCYDNYKLFIIISKTVLSTMKYAVGNGFIFCITHLFSTFSALKQKWKNKSSKDESLQPSITVKWKLKYWRRANFSSFLPSSTTWKKYPLYVQYWKIYLQTKYRFWCLQHFDLTVIGGYFFSLLSGIEFPPIFSKSVSIFPFSWSTLVLFWLLQVYPCDIP